MLRRGSIVWAVFISTVPKGEKYIKCYFRVVVVCFTFDKVTGILSFMVGAPPSYPGLLHVL